MVAPLILLAVAVVATEMFAASPTPVPAPATPPAAAHSLPGPPAPSPDPSPARSPVKPPAVARRPVPAAAMPTAKAQPTPPPSPGESDAALSALSWLAGWWSDLDAGGNTEEHWLPTRGGVMLGLQRSVSRRTGRAWFEYLRIEATADGLTYVASPGGVPGTSFLLTSSTEASAVFENPEHDFPRRITYRLGADGALEVAVDGGAAEPDRRIEWRWTRRPSSMP